jgi:hypothetical protein
VPAAEVGAVPLQERDLLLGEHVGVVMALPFEPQETLVAGLEVVSQPDATDARGADVHVLEPELVGYALGAVGGMDQAVIEDPLLDFGCDSIRVRPSGPALLFHQSGDAASLEGAADLVERISMKAHDAAGLRDVVQLVRELEQDSFLRVLCAKAVIRFLLGSRSCRNAESTSEKPGGRRFTF